MKKKRILLSIKPNIQIRYTALVIPLFFIAVLLARQAMRYSPVLAQTERVSVEVFPAAIELPPRGDSAEATIILRNPTTSNITNIRISYFTDAATRDPIVNVEGVPPLGELRTLGAGGECMWAICLSNKKADPITGNVFFRVSYDLQSGQASQPVPRLANTSIKVSTRELAEIAEVKIETTLDSLDEQHPGNVHLVITNKSNQSLRVKDIVSEGPEFISFDMSNLQKKREDEQKRTLSLTPHQTGVFPIKVRAESRVQPGKHLLLFTIRFEWGEAGSEQTRDLVVSKEVNVGVLGESSILTVLAVPSFLLVPGILILVTWGLLWKIGLLKSKRDTDQFFLQINPQPNNAEFWVVSATLSILVVILYMLVYKDFLRIYGLKDIISIWLFSVGVIGVAGYFLMLTFRNKRINRHVPSEKDSQFKILKKLHSQSLGIMREQVEFMTKTAGVEEVHRGFAIESVLPDRESLWVSPAIVVDGLARANADYQKAINLELSERGDPSELARLLQEGTKRHGIRVSWRQKGRFRGPCEIKTEDIVKVIDGNLIVIKAENIEETEEEPERDG
jgi:hypothetical protein